MAIKRFTINDYISRVIKFSAVVGKGTYIRSLANDLGARLGCGGTLISLRRIRIGDCRVDDAFDLGRLLRDKLR